MFIAAIKCDICLKSTEVPTSNSNASVPEGWALISPTVRIMGIKNPNNGKIFKERRDKLAALVKCTHVCQDCIEVMLTGKNTIKIGGR